MYHSIRPNKYKRRHTIPKKFDVSLVRILWQSSDFIIGATEEKYAKSRASTEDGFD